MYYTKLQESTALSLSSMRPINHGPYTLYCYITAGGVVFSVAHF